MEIRPSTVSRTAPLVRSPTTSRLDASLATPAPPCARESRHSEGLSPAPRAEPGGLLGGLFKAFAETGHHFKQALYQVADAVAPLLPVAAVAAWLIPGVGPAIGLGLKLAQAGVAGVKAIRAAESGDFLGALATGASAFSLVLSGPAAGIAARFGRYAGTARSVLAALKTGDVAGALGAIASVTGHQNLATAANVANVLQHTGLGAAPEASRRGKPLKTYIFADEVVKQSLLLRELEELTELSRAYEAKMKDALKSNGPKVKPHGNASTGSTRPW